MAETGGAAQAKIYTVKEGDTLTQIAKTFAPDTAMGVAELVDKLYELNKDVIGADKNLIRPGQALRIPTSPTYAIHTVTAADVQYREKWLDKLIRAYYKAWRTSDQPALIEKIRTHPQNAHIALDAPEVGMTVYLPDVGPAVGQSVTLPYNFYQPNIWLSRVPSMTDSIHATLDLFLGTLAKIDGISEQDVKAVIAEIVSPTADEREALNAVEGKTAHVRLLLELLQRIHAPGGAINWSSRQPNEGEGTLSTEVEDTHTTSEAASDAVFELKQLLNLYVFCCSLLHFVADPLLFSVASSLPGFWREKHFRKYPPVELIHEALRRASVDVEIVQRALVQRMRTDGRATITPQAKTLLTADKLAFKALAPFQHLLADEPINPITYFSEHTHVRRVPYVKNIVLIGITYAHISRREETRVFAYSRTILEDAIAFLKDQYQKQEEELIYWPAFELMAIPHEVGHFIYHHAATAEQGKTFAEMTQAFIAGQAETDADTKQLLTHWSEEIFADVYGCFVVGPLSAMGMQALLAASSEESLSRDDGEHPVAFLRPFLLSETLRALAKADASHFHFQTAPDQLDENWEKILQLRGYMPDSQGAFYTQINGQTTTCSDMLAAVRPIIHFYIRQLSQNAAPAQAPETREDTVSTRIPWSADEADLKRYDAEMENLIQSVTDKTLPAHSVNHIKDPSFNLQEEDNASEQAIKEVFDRVRSQQEAEQAWAAQQKAEQARAAWEASIRQEEAQKKEARAAVAEAMAAEQAAAERAAAAQTEAEQAQAVQRELKRLLDDARAQAKAGSAANNLETQLEQLQAEAAQVAQAAQARAAQAEADLEEARRLTAEAQGELNYLLSLEHSVPAFTAVSAVAAMAYSEPEEKVNLFAALVARLEDAADTAEQTLHAYLANWGDSGPTGHGDHPD